MSLLILTTSLAKAEDDVILEKGNSAPFRGVLVSPANYEIFTSDKLENEDFKDHMETYVKPHPDLGVQLDGPNLFWPGLVLGLITGLVAGRMIR